MRSPKKHEQSAPYENATKSVRMAYERVVSLLIFIWPSQL